MTLLGIVSEVNEEQNWKAPSPMVFTLLGIMTEVIVRLVANASSAITRVPSLIVQAPEVLASIRQLLRYNTPLSQFD
jgi:hypothetical protein